MLVVVQEEPEVEREASVVHMVEELEAETEAAQMVAEAEVAACQLMERAAAQGSAPPGPARHCCSAAKNTRMCRLTKWRALRGGCWRSRD